MSLPDFTATGDLPVGVHTASLAETLGRFGTSSHRRKLLAIRDVAGAMPPLIDIPSGLPPAKSAVIITDPPPAPPRRERAWLEPNPSEHNFTHENPFWQTFTVRTSAGIDSVFVLTNPRLTGYTEALEVAGGQEPPFRNFCPAEVNDSPTRARRNGWNLHLSACQQGKTLLFLYGYRDGRLDLYSIYTITVQ